MGRKGEKKKGKTALRAASSRGVSRWRTERARSTTVPVKDDALAVLDEVLADPLARAWMHDELSGVDRVNLGGGEQRPGVVAPLPRRTLSSTPGQTTHTPPMARVVPFSASRVRSFRRLFVWVWAAVRYLAGNAWDSVLGRGTIRSKARRLRGVLEKLGPTFIKLGQQLSVRADVLPFEYCDELSKMLDRVQPFPAEKAIAIFEESTGRKLPDTFAVFDPVPIGSASLACVFQALLHDGRKVAVKVQRPGIRPLLAADLRALDWLLGLAELIGAVRVGFTRNLSSELHTMLLEELDFRREARYTHIFKNRTNKKHMHFISAPEVYRELSSDRVLVTEFVSGVFLAEILGAIDRGDDETLANMAERGFEPKVICTRLAEVFNWETMESLLFHADPHPANIIVKPDNTIVMIDFGSCGRFSNRTRRLWHEIHFHMSNEDVASMVQASIAMLEPLPPIDVNAFTKEVEELYWDVLYATKDAHSEWWEKASGYTWMRFVGIARKYQIPMNPDSLRMFRATFLYDTVMYRLWSKVDLDKEYMRYYRSASKRSRRRIQRKVRRRLVRGFSDTDYMRAEELMGMGNQMLTRMQHFLDTPQHNFASVIGKAAYGVSVAMRALMLVLTFHLVAVVSVAVYQQATGHEVGVWEAFAWVIQKPSYQVVLAVLGLVMFRKALYRVEDVDVARK